MKKQKNHWALGLAIAFFLPMCLSAQRENIWLGGKTGRSADWHVAANWSKHRVPVESDEVVIPAGRAYPFISGNVAVRSLYVKTGAELIIRNGAMLAILACGDYCKKDIPVAKPASIDLQLDVNRKGELVACQSAPCGEQ